ncbi:DUF5959 family protein [Streptomyces formicae]|uniref:DUF5959 family protein n=1 Tax=Streptomyces formicae TaxID=1616117 RepID=UPI001F598CE9|nr:DUF5959 family protein [Streptomyces formicae]
MDLIRLSDGGNSVRVRVVGRRAAGILPLHDLLDAELYVESSFISGRLAICFDPGDLQAWSQALDALATGHDIEWLDQGNDPVIKVEFSHDTQGDITVLVEDGSGSGAVAAIPIALDEGWIAEQRELLQEVLQAWPSEVLETSPGAYEWR